MLGLYVSAPNEEELHRSGAYFTLVAIRAINTQADVIYEQLPATNCEKPCAIALRT